MKKLITDKTLTAFEKWFYEKYGNCSKKYEELLNWQKAEIMDWIFNACETIQHAFLIEFFLDNEMFILINPIDSYDSWMFTILGKDITSPFFEYFDSCKEELEFETKIETTIKAIQIADEIFNNNVNGSIRQN